MVVRVLIVTRSTVVIHVCCDNMSPAVGFWIFAPFPHWLPSFRALLRRELLLFAGSRWSIIVSIKAVIWVVWALAAEEKALSSSEISDVDAVAREGR